MKLCLSLIEENLTCKTIWRRIPRPDNQLTLRDWSFYEADQALEQDIVYLIDQETMGRIRERNHPDGGIFICQGLPEKDFFSEKTYYLAVEEHTEWNQLIYQLSHIFQRYIRCDAEFMDMCNRDCGIQDFVMYMYPFFENEIVVMDADFYVVGQVFDTIRINEISGLKSLNHQREPLELVNYFKNDKIYAKVRDERNPFLYSASVLAKDCLCMNIFEGNQFFLRFVVAEIEHPFREYDAAILQFFCSIIQKMYDRRKIRALEEHSEHFVHILRKLLEGEKVEIWRQYKGILLNGWKIYDPMLCVCVLPSDMDRHNNTIPYYCESLMNSFEGLWAFEQEEYIACVVNLCFYQNSEREFISKFVYYLREGYFRTGSSNQFRGLDNLFFAWKQARIALDLGMRHKKDIWNHRFCEYVLHYMIDQIEKELDYHFICAPELLKLCEHDQENGSAYYETLKKYLENHRNAIKTAEELFIHRGTMIYRLKRIRELTGLTLEDADELLYLRLSMKLIEKNRDSSGF